jgi:GT2 family glycosyltransferase
MIKRQVIDEVGGLDEQFYLYWEETDYCLRAKRAGYRVLIDAETYILHKSGSTIGGRQELYTYYVFRNRLLLMKKHARVAQWLTLAPLLPAYALVHIIRGWGEGNAPWAAAVAIKEACQDFSAGAFGKKRV